MIKGSQHVFLRKFFDMECRENLFALRDADNNPVWDALRFNIYMTYVAEALPVERHLSLREKVAIAIKGIGKALQSLLHMCLVPAEALIFEAPRYRNKQNRFFDKATQNIYDAENRCKTAVGDIKALHRYTHFVEMDFVWLYRKHVYKTHDLSLELMEKIINALQTLGEATPQREIINRFYNDFLCEKEYYQCYMRCKRPSYIVLNRSGIKKGLIVAAQRLHIPVFEVQHGMFSEEHLAYSYPAMGWQQQDIMEPDMFFVWSPYWQHRANIPCPTIALGNDFFLPDDNLRKQIAQSDRKTLLVISSAIHAKVLIPLTEQFALQYPDVPIMYKLHPNEYGNKHVYMERFADRSQIKVLTNEYTMPQLLLQTRLVVLINSTVFYESLSYGVAVAIFKRMNYGAYSDCFNMKGVSLIDNAEALYTAYVAHYRVDSTIEFFTPFNRKLFLETINTY